MASRSVACGTCSRDLDETPDLLEVERRPCPACGSLARRIDIKVSDELRVGVYELLKLRSPGRGKPSLERTVGFNLFRQTGRWNHIDRVIDYAADRYDEVITDPETGTVLDECHEPLSEHRGHGSARRR